MYKVQFLQAMGTSAGITSHWDQSGPPAGCPQHRKGCRRGAAPFQINFFEIKKYLQEVLVEFKRITTQKYDYVTEGGAETGSRNLLSSIYDQLFIRAGQSEEADSQHEALWKTPHEPLIKLDGVFSSSFPERNHSLPQRSGAVWSGSFSGHQNWKQPVTLSRNWETGTSIENVI